MIYTAEDIHRYFSGGMSADEMYAMDKAALNDPLLAEAMEGYHSLPSFKSESGYLDVQKQLDELKNRISGKTVSIKKYNNNWWKVAAAVLLLIGTAFAFYKMTSSGNKENNLVAKTDSTIKLHTENSDSTAIAGNEKNQQQIISTDSLKGSYKDLAVNERKPNNKNPVHFYSANPSATVTLTNTDNVAYQSWSDSSSVEKNNKDLAVNKPALSKASGNGFNKIYDGEDIAYQKKQHADVNFTGRITDAGNNAIPYAKLMINKRKTTRTDANGFFYMTLPDTSIRLDVAAYNYYPQTANVSANNFAGIILKAKKSTIRMGRNNIADSIHLSQVEILYKLGAEPKEGWIKYQQFLAQQCSNSEYDSGKPVNGITVVRFEIDSNGQPSNFQFEKSIDQDVNDAVESLIINGPEWNYTEHSAIPGIVKIKITF